MTEARDDVKGGGAPGAPADVKTERFYQVVNMALQVNAANIVTDEYGDEILVAPFKALRGNRAMNGVYYPDSVVQECVNSFEGVLAPLEHPAAPNGNFIPARSNAALRRNYIGGEVHNVRYEADAPGAPGADNAPTGRLVGEIRIHLPTARLSAGGRAVIAAYEAGDPISISTGLYIEAEQVPNGGTDPVGNKYTMVVIWCMADHIAILLRDIPASSTEEGTGLFVNAKGEETTMRRLVCNVAQDGPPSAPAVHPDDRLPVLELPETARNGLLTFLEGCGIPGLMKRREGATNRSDNTGGSDMTDSVANPEATPVANAVTEERLTQALAANQAETLEKFGEMLKPVVDATNAQTEAAKADADAKRAAAVETITNAGGYTAEELEGVPQPMLDKLAANASAPKSGAKAINATGDGDSAKTVRNSYAAAAKTEG